MAIGVLVIWMAYNDKKGYSIVLLSMAFCFPCSLSMEKSMTINQMWWFANVVREVTLLLFIYNFFFLKKNRSVLEGKAFVLFFFLLFVGVCFSIQNSRNSEYIDWTTGFICLFSLYYITFCDKIRFKEMFPLLDLIFVITAIYVILQFIFDICPYNNLYKEATNYDAVQSGYFIKQAKGLLGNPLVLSSIVILYQALLYIRLLLYKKFFFPLFVLCLIIGLFSVARTTIIVLVIEFIFYFIVSKIYSEPKKLLMIVMLVFLILGIIFFGFNEYIESNLAKFAANKAEHRFAVYNSVFNIVKDYPFGIGFSKITEFSNSHKYANLGVIRGFGTLDNFFLRQIAAYGILSIFCFLFYFFFLIKAFFMRNKNKKVFKSILLLYLTWGLIGFSFNLEAYLSILMIYAVLSAFLMRELTNSKKKRFQQFKRL